jgi:hypothetical protein
MDIWVVLMRFDRRFRRSTYVIERVFASSAQEASECARRVVNWKRVIIVSARREDV